MTVPFSITIESVVVLNLILGTIGSGYAIWNIIKGYLEKRKRKLVVEIEESSFKRETQNMNKREIQVRWYTKLLLHNKCARAVRKHPSREY